MDWPSLLALASRGFALAPAAFWRLSLPEWRALTAPSGPAPLGRADFAALAAAHPDTSAAREAPMSDPFDLSPPGGSGGLSAVPQAAAEATSALDAVRTAGAAAADSIDQAFGRAGTSLAKTLAKAAADGKLSLGELAQAAIEAVDAAFGRGSAGSGAGGLAGALGALLGSAFGGARADGGPVTPGGAYLVGERGPELFRPATAGSVDSAPGAGGGVTVNLNLPAGTDAPGLIRSESQVAQALARAVALGRR